MTSPDPFEFFFAKPWPDGLPTINIGANVLQATAESNFESQSSFSLPTTAFVVPWPRMVWRGETAF